MTETKLRWQGWHIVGWSTLVIGIMFVLILLIHGINEQGMRVAIRATARTSCLLFLSAFVASTLRRIWSSKLTEWLRTNRRYLGVSFAVSHAYHALAIIGLAIATAEDAVQTDHGGNLGYFLIIAMTATSFRSTAAWLGHRAWQILHTVGMYYLWLAFTYAFSLRLNESILIYTPFVGLLILAMMLRLIALKFRRRPNREII